MEVDTIYTGDCVDVMAGFPAGSVDLIVTSPPYDNLRQYNGYHFDFEAIAGQLWRVTRPGGVVVWVVGDATINGSETGTSFRQALYFMGLGFRLHDTMIYHTDKPPMNDNRYQACFEYMFVFSKGKPSVFNPLMIKSKHGGARNTSRVYFNRDGSLKNMSKPGKYNERKVKKSIWSFSSGNDKSGHPAAFPEALARDHILSWSNPGDIVLDPMCGSGTTCKMAALTGRHYIGIDISAEYVELTRRRVAQAVSRTVKALEAGDAFPAGDLDTDTLPLFARRQP